MKAKSYVLNSPEGVNFYTQRLVEPPPCEVGDVVEIELEDEEQETDLLAAGWLKAPAAAKKKEA